VNVDLFGNPIVEPTPRPSVRKSTIPNGYADIPGTGPAGQTCRSCAHYTHTSWTANKYRKCRLMQPKWTRGPGTDILARSPACRKWERK
jgi:hypothetical protein